MEYPGIVYPLYAYPNADVIDGLYTSLAQSTENAGVPLTVIANPDNIECPVVAEWQQVMDIFETSGARVLGYTHSLFGQRDLCEVLEEIQTYRDCWGVHGIFVDEGSNDIADFDYYLRIYAEITNTDPCTNVEESICVSSSVCSWTSVSSSCSQISPFNLTATCATVETSTTDPTTTTTSTEAPATTSTTEDSAISSTSTSISTEETTTSTEAAATTSTTEDSAISSTSTSSSTEEITSTTASTEAAATTSTTEEPATSTTSSGRRRRYLSGANTSSTTEDPMTTTTSAVTTTTTSAVTTTTGSGGNPYTNASWIVWLNPGTVVPEAYMAAADTIVQFEATMETYRSFEFPSYLTSYDKSRTAAMVLNTESCDLDRSIAIAANNRVGWVLVLDSDESYGLDRYVKPELPSYWSDEVTLTASFSRCVARISNCDSGGSDTSCCAGSEPNTCQVCDTVVSTGCSESSNSDAVSTEVMIGLISAGLLLLLVLIGVLIWYCNKRKSTTKAADTRTQGNNSPDPETGARLRPGTRVQVVSRKQWHEAEVLHVHSDGRVTCKRLEDNKIARLVPRNKVRFNGIRLSEMYASTNNPDRYEVVHMDKTTTTAAAATSPPASSQRCGARGRGRADPAGAAGSNGTAASPRHAMDVQIRHGMDGKGPIYTL